MTDGYVLTLACGDRPGIVAAVATLLATNGGNIREAQQFDDAETGRFFMRVVFDMTTAAMAVARPGIDAIAKRFSMALDIRSTEQRKRVLILASRFDHCLSDLVYRYRTGDIAMDVVGVVSNHPRVAFDEAMIGDLAFHHLPLEAEARHLQEARIEAIVAETDADLIVLARYMQVLSDDLATRLAGRCINIHHSFLPGFKGAKPYHQAHARGVKLIGATAHFVTPDLDEGPIIEQRVERIGHGDTPDDLIRKGRDIERRVLAQAVRWFVEDRILLNGAKTVVFRD